MVVQEFSINEEGRRFLASINIPTASQTNFQFEQPVLVRKGQRLGVQLWHSPLEGVRADIVKRIGPLKRSRRSRRRWRHKLIGWQLIAAGRPDPNLAIMRSTPDKYWNQVPPS